MQALVGAGEIYTLPPRALTPFVKPTLPSVNFVMQLVRLRACGLPWGVKSITIRAVASTMGTPAVTPAPQPGRRAACCLQRLGVI